MPYNLPLTVFTQSNFVADFLQEKCDFREKAAILRFWTPHLEDLGAMYDDHCKARSGLPISPNELFSLGVTAEALRAIIGSKSAISLQQQPVHPKFQVEGVAPHQPFLL